MVHFLPACHQHSASTANIDEEVYSLSDFEKVPRNLNKYLISPCKEKITTLSLGRGEGEMLKNDVESKRFCYFSVNMWKDKFLPKGKRAVKIK